MHHMSIDQAVALDGGENRKVIDEELWKDSNYIKCEVYKDF